MSPRHSIDFRVESRVLGPMHVSGTGVARTARPSHRPIGVASSWADQRKDGCEYLSATAKQRYERDANYRPPELKRYLSQGEVRLEPVPLPTLDGDAAGADQTPPTIP